MNDKKNIFCKKEDSAREGCRYVLGAVKENFMEKLKRTKFKIVKVQSRTYDVTDASRTSGVCRSGLNR